MKKQTRIALAIVAAALAAGWFGLHAHNESLAAQVAAKEGAR